MLNKEDYINKSREILSDESTYICLNGAPTFNIQKKINGLIEELKYKKYINETDYKRLLTDNSIPPKFYGLLPKMIHKEGIHSSSLPVVVVVVATINSAFYKIPFFIANNILSISLTISDINDYNITDTFTFMNELKKFQLPDNFVLVSFDAFSFYIY